jgi:hypothetical protein
MGISSVLIFFPELLNLDEVLMTPRHYVLSFNHNGFATFCCRPVLMKSLFPFPTVHSSWFSLPFLSSWYQWALSMSFENWSPWNACSLNSFIHKSTYTFLRIFYNIIKHVQNNLSFFSSKHLSTCTLYQSALSHSVVRDFVSQYHCLKPFAAYWTGCMRTHNTGTDCFRYQAEHW